MNYEIWGVALQVLILVLLSYPLGRYIATVYRGEKSFMDFLTPIENCIYKVCSIDPKEQMGWKRFLSVLLTLNLFWFVWGMVLVFIQGFLPLNPDGNVGQSASQAFNTCISFLVNCNLQHYSGENGLTYFTQIFVIMLFQFVTAATGMAAFAAVLKGMCAKTSTTLGNFWVYLIRTLTRILIPLSMVVGMLLIVGGTPMTLEGKQTITTLEGTEQVISQGPVAAIVAIKQLGTNGGGFFGVNSSHPLENPSYFTNMVECISILLIPMALIWCLGFYLKKRKFAACIFGVMFIAYITTVDRKSVV